MRLSSLPVLLLLKWSSVKYPLVPLVISAFLSSVVFVGEVGAEIEMLFTWFGLEGGIDEKLLLLSFILDVAPLGLKAGTT